jgi:ubiquinone biosynthesis protein
MNTLRYISRLLRILWVFRKHGLLRFLAVIFPHWSLRLLCSFDGYSEKTPLKERALQLRLALEDLGPIFVKFGQLLSTRQDLLADELIVELSKLQDKVTPFSTELFISILEESLEKPLTELFTDFESTPLGSASIAQVHAARLFSGEDIVIKILRPKIKEQILSDLAVLHGLATTIEYFIPQSARLHPCEVVNEFEHTIIDELDLLREGANACQLKKNFLNSAQLKVPKIYWDYTRHNILVLERIYGVQINDIQKLRAAGTNLKKLAENGVEIFFTQVFRDRFFHADMHPGNVFVDLSNPQSPKYIAVDFGIMGTLDQSDQRYLAENFLAFFNQDYRRVAELHLESGWVPATVRVEDFEAAIRSVCEPIFEKPLREISFGHTLLRLFQTAQRFEMELQPQLLLLQKTLVTIEGVGRQLYPDLDLWQTAKPYLESWIRERFSARALLKQLKRQAPYWIEQRLHPINPKPKLLNASLSTRPTQNKNSNLGPACIISGAILIALNGDPLKIILGSCLILSGLVLCLFKP